MQLQAEEKPLGKWYYRFEAGRILFPTYFETYFRTDGITPMNFVWDKELGAVAIHNKKEYSDDIDDFSVYKSEHVCIDLFLREQWDRGFWMHKWNFKIPRHRELFNIFMEKYSHMIMTNPQGDANQIYIEMDKDLQTYK
jgi:hypothetical protein